MNEKEIIREIMNELGWTQDTLREKLGYSTQSAVSSRLNGSSMRVDTFVKFLSAMNYKLVVVSASPNKNKNKWVVRETEQEEE